MFVSYFIQYLISAIVDFVIFLNIAVLCFYLVDTFHLHEILTNLYIAQLANGAMDSSSFFLNYLQYDTWHRVASLYNILL